MKKKSIKLKKLSISKATVATLNSQEQGKIAGGATGGGCSMRPPCFSLKTCPIE